MEFWKWQWSLETQAADPAAGDIGPGKKIKKALQSHLIFYRPGCLSLREVTRPIIGTFPTQSNLKTPQN